MRTTANFALRALAASAVCGMLLGAAASAQQGSAPPPTVTVVTLEASDVTLTAKLPGRVEASRMAEVRPQVSGVIEKRLFEEGQEVEAGQPLYKIDSRTYQAAVATAKAELARSQATLKSNDLRAKRFKKLLDYKAVSKRVKQFIQASQFNLIETLAENVAKIILEEFDVLWLKLRISKPFAIRD